MNKLFLVFAWINLLFMVVLSTEQKSTEAEDTNILEQFQGLFKTDNVEKEIKLMTGPQTDFPTSSPTGAPTSLPIAFPTGAPSTIPSGFPTNKPTSHPVTVPTTIPSGLPSELPSSLPSGLPSVQPTGHPTRQPFSHPTGQPSRQPTGQPTVSPTHPTAAPTFRPSPSLAPTAVVTTQTQPVVNAQGSLSTGGNTSPEPSPQGKTAATNTASQIYGGSATLTGTDSTPQTTRRLTSEGGHLRSLDTVTLYVYTFHFVIKYNMIDYPQFNGNITKLVVQINQNVSKAISSGDASKILRQQATYLGATEMKNANATGYAVSYSVASPPGGSTSSPRLTDGQVAGLVVGIVVGTILIWALIYWFVIQKREKGVYTHNTYQDYVTSDRVDPSSPKIGDRVVSGFADDAMVIYVDQETEGAVSRDQQRTLSQTGNFQSSHQRQVTTQDVEIRI